MGTSVQIASLVGLLALGTAAEAEPLQGKEGQARLVFQRGSLAYKLGRFDEALNDFQAAARLANRPSILFNIAQCHRQLNEVKQAHFGYLLYLSEWERLHPGQAAPFQQEVKSHIAELRERLRVTPKESAVVKGSAATKVVKAEPSSKVAAVAIPLLQRQPARPSQPWYRKWWVWTAAVGVVATFAGIVVASSGTDSVPMGTLPPGQVPLR